jgi:hypothetical protein
MGLAVPMCDTIDADIDACAAAVLSVARSGCKKGKHCPGYIARATDKIPAHRVFGDGCRAPGGTAAPGEEERGWLKTTDFAKYLATGVIFTFLQCFVVTSMITDGQLRIQSGDFADEELLFEQYAPTIESKWQSALPPRDIKYCKMKDEWDAAFLAVLNFTKNEGGDWDAAKAQQWANHFMGTYNGCVEPISDDSGGAHSTQPSPGPPWLLITCSCSCWAEPSSDGSCSGLARCVCAGGCLGG